MMIDWRQNVPDGQKREYSGYSGTYTYDGTQLVTTVDVAPDPSRIGTIQPRGRVRFENGLMILVPPPRVVDGVTEHSEIVMGEDFGCPDQQRSSAWPASGSRKPIEFAPLTKAIGVGNGTVSRVKAAMTNSASG